MRSVICVHERFDAYWPFAADYWQACWQTQGKCELYRSEDPEARVTQFVTNPETVTRLVLLGFPAEDEDLTPFTGLEECFVDEMSRVSTESIEKAELRGVSFIKHMVDVYWGQSVAEYGLALTLCALRRIPQTYSAMMQSHDTWKYMPDIGKPNQRGVQYGDDSKFTNGTLKGKRVRIVGAGNIGARYASFCTSLGAEVAIWDPFAPDASFVVAGAKRCFHVSELVKDADIFVPMVPLKEDTKGLITAELINALPYGSLVVQVTRAKIVDTEALYKRVLNNELALAADVFDVEPLPLESPLLGRHNVVHTPHNAGRTKDANYAWADDQMARFKAR